MKDNIKKPINNVITTFINSIKSPSQKSRNFITPTSKNQKNSSRLIRQNSESKLYNKNNIKYQQTYYDLTKSQQKHIKQSNSNQKILKRSNSLFHRSSLSNLNIDRRNLITDIYHKLELINIKEQSLKSIISYKKILVYLYLLKYIKYQTQEDYISNSQKQQLKKIYQLWLSLSQNSICLKINIILFIFALEGITADLDEIKKRIGFKQKKIIIGQDKKSRNSLNYSTNQQQNPQYIFFVKKKNYSFDQNGIIQLQNQKQRLYRQYGDFIKNKLKRKQIQNQGNQIKLFVKKSQQTQQSFKYNRQNITNKLKIIQLQNQSKNHHLQLKILSRPRIKSKQKRSDQIQYHKQQKQYTFKPIIHEYKSPQKKQQMNKMMKKIKNVDKTIYRMKQAKYLKDQKQLQLKTGWTNNNSGQRYQDKQNVKKRKIILFKSNCQDINYPLSKDNISKQKQINNIKNILENITNNQQISSNITPQQFRIPILYIDVNIQEGKKQRIIIYDGDKANLLSKQFGKKHGLDQQTIQRLQEMLSQQINSVLTRIQQQPEQQCSILV